MNVETHPNMRAARSAPLHAALITLDACFMARRAALMITLVAAEILT